MTSRLSAIPGRTLRTWFAGDGAAVVADEQPMMAQPLESCMTS